jgi:hypothetical protein
LEILKMLIGRIEIEVAQNVIPAEGIDTSGHRDERNAQED